MIVEAFMGISFNFIYHNPKETAPPLSNSKGTAKGRIHLLPYSGKENKDEYAVAAKLLRVKEGKSPPKSLGLIDRRYYILVKDPNKDNIYYKINKVSLEKRLGFSKDEITTISKLKNPIESQKAILNKIHDTIKPTLTKLNIAISNTLLKKTDKKEISNIIREIPPKYMNLLLNALIEENDLITSNRASLYTVLDMIIQDPIRSISIALPEETKGRFVEWQQTQKRIKMVQDLDQFQIPQYRPASIIHDLTSNLIKKGYRNFQEFINKIELLPKEDEKTANETIDKIAELGFKAFRGSLPSSFHHYSDKEREESVLLMGEFLSAFDALPKEAKGTQRSQCLSKVCHDVGHMIQQRMTSLNFSKPDEMQAAEKLIKSITEILEELLFKDIPKDSYEEVMQALIHQSTVKEQVVKHVIEGCLFCKHAGAWKEEDFEKNILSIHPDFVGIAIKFLPQEERQKGLQALGYDDYRKGTLQQRASKEDRTYEFYHIRLLSVKKAMSPKDQQKYFG
jgi:hypothetical protein